MFNTFAICTFVIAVSLRFFHFSCFFTNGLWLLIPKRQVVWIGCIGMSAGDYVVVVLMYCTVINFTVALPSNTVICKANLLFAC